MPAVTSVVAILFFAVALAHAATPEDFIATHAPRFWEGREFPGAQGSVHVTEDNVSHTRFDFSGGGNYVETFFDLSAPEPVKLVTFEADKPAGYILTVRVRDSRGQCFQKTVRHALAGWTTFRFDMEHFSGHFGGPNDGLLQQPIKGFSILVENTHQPVASGELQLRNISTTNYTPEEQEALRAARPRGCTRHTVADFGGGTANTFERGQYGAQPAGSLRDGVLSVDFAKGGSATVRHSLAILGVPEELLLTVEADADAAGAELEIGIGSHFMTFTRTVGEIRKPVRKGQKIWQTFVIPAPPAEGWSWRGGANDGVARYPLRFSHLTVRKGAATRTAFAIRLVALEACSRIPQQESLALRTRLLTSDDRPSAMDVELKNLDTDAHAGTLTLELKDWDGGILTTSATNLAPLASGETQRLQLSLPAVPDARRHIECFTTFQTESKGLSASWSSTWTAPMADAGTADLRPDLPWGMGVYLYRNGADEAGLKAMDRVAGLAQAAGVKWSREEFQWQRMEPRRGVYDFTFYDALVDTARRHGISVYALVCYWTPWTKPYEEEGFDDYCAFLRVLVRRYKDRIKHWEIYNEPNIFFWSGPRERYPILLKRAYEAVKAEDPEAQVLGCSTSGIDNRFIQMCLDAKAPFDSLTIHPYRATLSEASFISELEATRKQVGGRDVWITEMGWPTIPGGASEQQQAALLARSYLSAVGCGACRNICWYNFRNDGWNPYYNEENFGIMYQDLAPKPAYRALAAVCRTFPSGTPQLTRVPLLKAPGSLYLFSMGDAAAIWSDECRATVAVETQGTPVVKNLMGETLVAKRQDGAWIVETDPQHPVFFERASVTRLTPIREPQTENQTVAF